ncbi:MAG: TonB-dependent receptor [Acidobacteriota bacterium]
MTASCAAAEVRLNGRVTNDNNTPVASARVTLRSPDGAILTAVTDPAGVFTFRLPGPRESWLAAEREGYFRLAERPVHLVEGANEVHLILNPLREVFESVDVRASPSRVDFDRTTVQRSLSGAEILAVPFPSSNNLKNALRIMPGVVQDSKGGVHLNGGAEEQVLYTLNGFNLNDPLTGRFESRLSVEAVQSIEVGSGRLPAEFGKGSAGMLAITTSPGDNKLRYSATNFFPGVESHKGLLVGNWTPRLNLSGPIRRGRAWFSNSFVTQYDKQVIEELPSGADQMSSWRFSNLLHTQVNLSPSHILYAGILTNVWNAPRTGLSILNPPETTVDRRSRQWFFNIKDQVYFRRGLLVEFGYAANRTFGREIPQGHAFLRLTPEGNAGNAFADAARKAGRDQVLANIFFPAVSRAGVHQFKAGIGLDRVTYWQHVRRTGFEHRRADGSPAARVVFGGPSQLGRSNLELSSYFQDAWRVRAGLLAEAGLRADWDRILGHVYVSPRAGLAWAPPGLTRTKISAGYSVVYEATSLRLFTRPLDQYSLTTYFDRQGQVVRGPAVSVFVFGHPRPPAPRAGNWSAGLERELAGSIYARLNYLRRRGRRGFTYANVPLPDGPPPQLIERSRTSVFDAVYRLANDRRDVFDSFEVTVRQTFRRQYGWLASYTRSRALSNGVVDINIDDPIIVSDNVGPMPWDSPNRFLSWGYLPLPWENWAAAYLLEWRTGFPFSVYSGEGKAIGGLNSRRFPQFFALNLHGERRFSFRGHRWEFRLGFNNLTGHRNPNVVNANADSPNFLRFYGGQSRSFNFRIRWLGRAAR